LYTFVLDSCCSLLNAFLARGGRRRGAIYWRITQYLLPCHTILRRGSRRTIRIICKREWWIPMTRPVGELVHLVCTPTYTRAHHGREGGAESTPAQHPRHRLRRRAPDERGPTGDITPRPPSAAKTTTLIANGKGRTRDAEEGRVLSASCAGRWRRRIGPITESQGVVRSAFARAVSR